MLSSDFKPIVERILPSGSIQLFLGVFPLDLIPRRRLKVHHFFIANLSPSGSEGSHWFLVYKNDVETAYGKNCSVFDYG